MQRVVILGRGASGKSTLARGLGRITKLPVIELDKVFWLPGLLPTPRDAWSFLQQQLATREQWIMDGDLGPYDAVEARLRRADTVILLDFSLIRCAWQAVKRSRERGDFWRWVIAYRRKYLPLLLQAIAQHASTADVLIFREPRAAERFLNTMRASEATRRQASSLSVAKGS
jgi:adenylate kinase family enzyme